MTARVELGERSYDIHVGRGVVDRLDELLVIPDHAAHVVVVTQQPVAEHHLAAVLSALSRTGLEVSTVVIEDGEQAKNVTALSRLWESFAAVPMGRHDLVVALGGGIVGDLAGFAAASWNRGISICHVPTTLLAQVDSAIGGKTGLNLAAGKNLVGAFHQPSSVVVDVDVLATLPKRQVVAGLGEVVKYGFIRDPEILQLLQADPSGAVNGNVDLLKELVRRSVAVKAAVVSGDERESGERAHLNFGHTFGHAVEALTGYTQLLHGEAVAIGMAMALRLGVAEGRTSADLVERLDEVCGALGLPTRAPRLDRDEVWRTMTRDKKARDGVRWVLVGELGEVHVGHVQKANVDSAIDQVQA